MKTVLLAGSESRWLRDHASSVPFVRRAVRRFMPGEQVEDAFAASAVLARQGITSVLTQLGENVSDRVMSDRAADHYLDVLRSAHERALDCDISVKLTHLGLDIDEARCLSHTRTLAEHAGRYGRFVWIDMEQHTYVDRTLHIYTQLVSEFPHVGVCLQAYLYRTADDLTSLVPLGGGLRLVKGAYREPAAIAYPKKREVDDHFFELAARMLSVESRAAGLRPVFGTHDRRLIDRIQRHADAASIPRKAFEFHMLYGIQRAKQLRLVRDGYRVRVLISYGEHWFPWYMRRLAERPANLLFVAKSMVSR